MANLSNRIAELSPEKRELLHRLLSKEQGAEATLAQAQPDSPAISPAISQDMIEAIRSNAYASYTFASSAEKKTLTRQLYNLVSSQLNAPREHPLPWKHLHLRRRREDTDERRRDISRLGAVQQPGDGV